MQLLKDAENKLYLFGRQNVVFTLKMEGMNQELPALG
jgi:hypothetical protein